MKVFILLAAVYGTALGKGGKGQPIVACTRNNDCKGNCCGDTETYYHGRTQTDGDSSSIKYVCRKTDYSGGCTSPPADLCQCVPPSRCLDKPSGPLPLQCGDSDSPLVCCYNITNECGRINTDGVGVTITGFKEDQAQLGEFPWMVAVLGKDNAYVGGGSLVDARVILTAAHKVQNFNASNLVARIGDWDLSAESEPIPSQNINVQKVLFHPEFNKGTLVNDVALLILETDATLGLTVMPVCLPEIDQEFDGSSCFVTGWAKDVFGKQGKDQKIMKKASVPAISHSQCQSMIRNTRLWPTFNLHNTFNCAGGQGEDACEGEGDGGSPLVCPNPNNNGQYIQMGVVAWGIGCGQVGSPGVYGSIPKTVKWIREIIPKEVGFQIRTGAQDNGGGRGK